MTKKLAKSNDNRTRVNQIVQPMFYLSFDKIISLLTLILRTNILI